MNCKLRAYYNSRKEIYVISSHLIYEYLTPKIDRSSNTKGHMTKTCAALEEN